MGAISSKSFHVRARVELSYCFRARPTVELGFTMSRLLDQGCTYQASLYANKLRVREDLQNLHVVE